MSPPSRAWRTRVTPVSAVSYTVKAVVTASNDAPVYVAGGTSALPTVSEDVTTAAEHGRAGQHAGDRHGHRCRHYSSGAAGG